MSARRIVVMGVTATGKSAVGAALAEALGARFVDGDDLHPASNRRKMAEGTPLDDADRAPWLAEVGRTLAEGGDCVVACSALKRRYRTAIDRAAGGGVRFVFLDAPRALVKERLRAREGHFMPASLIRSQFETLEPPGADEGAVRLAVDRPVAQVVQAALRGLGLQAP
ncbi:gluconokinase [Jannaschia sp. W003]|uniref:gluconokinase n=1 Tax=Jannaschia sp. W003 TaxID=2867012 RepID=UPI0021A83487|nr:gluconokinase [Jannaschia sp. W003]UWQ21868.1 gluconokinase [Jannaschia sp. W003]